MDFPYRHLQVGVLAIQGAFARHLEVLADLRVRGVEVRNPEDLKGLNGLIIPGGETTTMLKVMRAEGTVEPLIKFGHNHPVLGTCAGMVLMGREVDDQRITPFDWMPLQVYRNAYGSQVNSFRDVGVVPDIKGHPEVEMVFIRAPKFAPLADSVQILGTCRGEPVLARYGTHVASAFHPELTDDNRIHRLWLDGVLARQTAGAQSAAP